MQNRPVAAQQHFRTEKDPLVPNWLNRANMFFL